jgi:hypothetical protein
MADVASSSLAGSTNAKLGFLVVTVLTMVSKLQDSSNKHQLDSVRLSIKCRSAEVGESGQTVNLLS